MVYTTRSIEEGEPFVQTEEEELSSPLAAPPARFSIRRDVRAVSVLVGLLCLLALAWSSPTLLAAGRKAAASASRHTSGRGVTVKEEISEISDETAAAVADAEPADSGYGSSTSPLRASVNDTTGLWGPMGMGGRSMGMGGMPPAGGCAPGATMCVDRPLVCCGMGQKCNLGRCVMAPPGSGRPAYGAPASTLGRPMQTVPYGRPGMAPAPMQTMPPAGYQRPGLLGGLLR